MLPYAVVGAGIVGLATARALQQLDPVRNVIVVDKESSAAAHQTGRNSGVIHSGLYYTPGSLKAELARRGAEELKDYCRARGIAFDSPGKLVVATRTEELPRLVALKGRAVANRVRVREADATEIRQREPHVRALRGLVVESTGRVNFGEVARSLADEIREAGGELLFDTPVSAVTPRPDGSVTVSAGDRSFGAYRAAVCAGLHSDVIARASGVDPAVRILPFRGEFFQIRSERSELVQGLVYPVPDPALPFLGVHLTRGLDGTAKIGPNAVPAFAREGYRWRTISARDLGSLVTFPGTWKLAARYGGVGAKEIIRSLSGRALLREARRMLPDLTTHDLERAASGVRAQAVSRDGALVDDFLFARQRGVLHVLNAPSPAATASLVIGQRIAQELAGE